MSTSPTESSRANSPARGARQKKRLRAKSVAEPTTAASAHPEWQDWERWTRKLQSHHDSAIYRQLLPGAKKKTSPFAWFLPKSPEWILTAALLDVLHSAARQQLSPEDSSGLRDHLGEWLAGAAIRLHKAPLALEALAWTAISPLLPAVVEQQQWIELMQLLEQLATQAGTNSMNDDPLRLNLLAEIGWWLALLYPNTPQWHGLTVGSRESMSHSLCELTDGEGLPAARHWPMIRPLLACWTRSAAVAGELKETHLQPEAAEQLKWLLRQCILLTRADGSQVLGNDEAPAWNRAAFCAALGYIPDRLSHSFARPLLPRGRRIARAAKLRPKKNLPARASNVSEWAEGAVLRTGWSKKSALYALTFNDRQLTSEFAARKQLVWSGSAEPVVLVDGQPLSIHEIRVACLFHDKDVEYLELEIDCGRQWKLQRQMLLGRADEFLFIGDAILGPQAAEISYRSTLPLAADIDFQPAHDTRETALLGAQGVAVRVLPLSLPEWRAERSTGELARENEGLVFSSRATTAALYCPLFIDYSKDRADRELTWRRLTVAEERLQQPSSRAVGYRVQIGKRQWLIYRSLTGKTARSVLGQHLLHEFVVGRFLDSGEMEPLLQIEPADE